MRWVGGGEWRLTEKGNVIERGTGRGKSGERVKDAYFGCYLVIILVIILVVIWLLFGGYFDDWAGYCFAASL